MIQRRANAQWNGDLKSGSGIITTESGALSDTPYSFQSRFENGRQTNPEELIGAAHAGCFSMALSNELASAQLNPESVATEAEVSLDRDGASWKISKVHLHVRADVPGANREAFMAAAEKAKANCPVSRLLNAEITLTAELEDYSEQARQKTRPTDSQTGIMT